jgi:hypothetical protein
MSNVTIRFLAAVVLGLPLGGCVHAVMMGGMGAGMMMGHRMRQADRACGDAMTDMRAHLRRLDAAGADSVPALVPVHRQKVEALLSRCDAEATDMHQPAGTTWRSIAEQLRQDLIRLPQRAAAELPAFMAEHRGRIVQFLALREGTGQR